MVRKARTLERLDRLNDTMVRAVQKNAGAIGLGSKRQAGPRREQIGMPGGEIVRAETQKTRNPIDFGKL